MFYKKHKINGKYGTDIQTFSTVPYRTREYGVPYRTHASYPCLTRNKIYLS